MAALSAAFVILLLFAGGDATANRCGAPPVVANSNVVINTTTSAVTPYVTAVYTCDTTRGYAVQGVGTIACVTMGNQSVWSNLNFTCARAQCRGVPQVENATTDTDFITRTVKSRYCTYYDRTRRINGCAYYYTYVAYTTTYNTKDIYYGDHVNATCRPGYRFPDNSTSVKIECNAQGKWVLPDKTCQPKDCGYLTKYEGMSCEEAPTFYPTQVRCNCGIGYERNVSSGTYLRNRYGSYIRDVYGQLVFINKTENNYTIKCAPSGSWDRPDVTPGRPCSRVICSPLPQVQNIDTNKTVVRGLRYKDTVTYFCKRGYDSVGDTTITCLSNKTWTVLPQCVGRDCGPHPTIQNGHIKSGTAAETIVGNTVQYVCDIGFRMVSNNFTRCGEEGTWSTLPVCHRIRCGEPPMVSQSRQTVNGHYYGDKTSYKCDEGLTLYGNSSISCQFDGHWTAPPSCYPSDQSPESTTLLSLPETSTTAEGAASATVEDIGKSAIQLERSSEPEKSNGMTAGIVVLTVIVVVLLLAVSFWYIAIHKKRLGHDIVTSLSINNPLYKSEDDTTTLHPVQKHENGVVTTTTTT